MVLIPLSTIHSKLGTIPAFKHYWRVPLYFQSAVIDHVTVISNFMQSSLEKWTNKFHTPGPLHLGALCNNWIMVAYQISC